MTIFLSLQARGHNTCNWSGSNSSGQNRATEGTCDIYWYTCNTCCVCVLPYHIPILFALHFPSSVNMQ